MNPHNASSDTYDRGIVPAETAARKEREGENFKKIPHNTEEGSIDTTGGYTVGSEGLINNFAIEPEMYIDIPGDLREEEAAAAAERAADMRTLNQTDEDGKLTIEEDNRGKGVGAI